MAMSLKCYALRGTLLRALLFTSGLLLGLAQWQTGAHAGPSAEHLAEARALLDDIHAGQTVEQVMQLVLKAQIPLIKKAEPGTTDKQIEAFSTAFIGEFHKHADEFLADMAGIYAAQFTLEEIKGIRKFWTSPTGRKFILAQPEMMKAGATIGQAWAVRILPSAVEVAKKKMKQT